MLLLEKVERGGGARRPADLAETQTGLVLLLLLVFVSITVLITTIYYYIISSSTIYYYIISSNSSMRTAGPCSSRCARWS